MFPFVSCRTWKYSGYSLFHEACVSKHPIVVEVLLKHANELKLELNSSRGDGQQPFAKSVVFGESREVLKMLLEDERIEANATDNKGCTALMYICGNSHNNYGDYDKVCQVISMLLKSPRIDTNVADKNGMTALHHACKPDTMKIEEGRHVELYLEAASERKGIDVNQRDKNGRTPLHFAFGCRTGACYYHFVPPFSLKRFSATIEAILKFVDVLSIDLNAVDTEGKTPLHYLYMARKQSLVTQFLEAAKNEYNVEFDVNAVDHSGRTPIQYAHQN